MHIAGNGHIIAFENISKIGEKLSDAICRLNTGTGHSERKYYEQGTLFQTNVHCPVFINGIPPNLAEREDLIDRSVTFAFQILGEKSVSDDMLWRKFAAIQPRLLGALLDGVVGAMKIRRQFGDDNDAAAAELLDGWRPRFVDHVVFAEAACQTMGFRPLAFKEAYQSNQDFLLRYFATHNPVCVGIVKLMEGKREWRGYPDELHKAIRPYASGLEEKLKGSGSWLSRESLPRAIGALRKVHGIVVETKLSFRSGDNNTGIRITWHGNHGTHFRDAVTAVDADKPTISSPKPSPVVTRMGTMPTTPIKLRRLPS
jgi:hypothetical protein